jgi:hypothetical protein
MPVLSASLRFGVGANTATDRVVHSHLQWADVRLRRIRLFGFSRRAIASYDWFFG